MVLINGTEVGRTGYGLMGLTWRPVAIPHTQAFKAMKNAVDTGTFLWNGGTFYGPPTANSLHLLQAYFKQYPEDAKKAVISIKGPIAGDEKSVRNTVDKCLEVLQGTKKLDIFQCARVDPRTPVEETIRVLAQLIKEGKFDAISMSEATPENIRRAAKIHKIACLEVEFSLYATEILHNGVVETCAELGIPIVAYSPLGRGYLTTAPQRADELLDGDVRKNFPRIQPENYEHNLRLAQEVAKVAEAKRCSITQLAMAWVRHHNNLPGFPAIIPIPGATTAERVEENSIVVDLTDSEFQQLNDAVKRFDIIGTRYP